MSTLHRIFEDIDLKTTLAEFFDLQATADRLTAAEIMGRDHPDAELARKHACYAKAYEEVMNRLRAYADQH